VTETQATALVERTLAMFHNATGDHGAILLRHFLPRDVATAEAAVHRYAERSKFLDTKDFLDVLAGLDGKDTRPPVPPPPSPYLARRAARRAQYRSWEAKVDADTRRIDALLAPVPDEELERLRSEIVADRAGTMPDKLLKRLRDGDPRKSPWLRSLIAERLGAVTA
jgi:hypothetical protein